MPAFASTHLHSHSQSDMLSDIPMKPQYIFLALTLTLTATAAIQQGDPPAEKAFKNIKTLTGTPSSEVIPSMKFMSASLKVDCEFCHKGDDFASDEKQAKEAARHMIVMQRDINTKNFNGRTQVTCNTCHNGSPNPQAAPSAGGISRRTIKRGGAALTPADVLKKFQDASGSDLQAVKLEGTESGFSPTSGPITITQGSPNKFVMEFNGQKVGYDGTVAWFQAGTTPPQALPPDHAASIVHFGRFFRGANAFSTFGDLRFVGRDKIDGKEVNVLRSGSQNDKVSEDLYFDAGTGLLTRIVSYTTTVLGNIPESADFADYRKVGDAMVPFSITQSGGKDPKIIKIEKSTVNPKLTDGFFSLPKS